MDVNIEQWRKKFGCFAIAFVGLNYMTMNTLHA